MNPEHNTITLNEMFQDIELPLGFVSWMNGEYALPNTDDYSENDGIQWSIALDNMNEFLQFYSLIEKSQREDLLEYINLPDSPFSDYLSQLTIVIRFFNGR